MRAHTQISQRCTVRVTTAKTFASLMSGEGGVRLIWHAQRGHEKNQTVPG